MHNIVIDCKDCLTPCHLPVCAVIAGKFPTMGSKLCSHFTGMKKFLGMIGLSVLVCSYVYNILKFALHHYMAWIILLRKPSFCMCPVGCVCGCLAVQLYGGIQTVKSTPLR